ncbi:substrate-binding domain-containing protein [Cryobacterium sp.]|jgi:ribose transport system substrate-binding protein|uniref:sugar ABC transporter substrate-binding protein n=1 Tax=Cryobacterium sp. TaxID=1926290 RepID=UPI0026345679|nr:substrate-binding domain-containing protein [Cryobacterium sp.]MCU1446419.1 Sugar transporter substrate-binding protein [Cryobacterium sp.]
MKITPTLAGLALALGASLTLAGCTSATDAAQTADVTSTADLTATQQECVSALQADVDTATADTALVAPTEPLDLAALSGGTVWMITVSMNQFSTDMATGVQAAADAAGVELVTYDGQGLANRFNEGISQAVAQDAAGIILVGIDPTVVTGSLAAAAAAGIPVQNTLNGDPTDEVPEGMYINLTSDFTADGETAAKWALIDSRCQADMVSLYSSSVGVWQKMVDGAESVFAEYCPEDCTFKALNVDIANVSTDIGSQLQTALQQNLDVNYVYPVWDSAVPFVSPVMSAANSSAKVLSRDGLEANLAMIADNSGQAMTIAMPTTSWIGWIAFDSVARAATGTDVPEYVIPTRIIDSTTIGDGTAGDLFPEYDGYQSAFTDAWAK